MIGLSADALSVLASSAMLRYVRMESWRGGELLAELDQPLIHGAVEEVNRGQRVHERLTFSVPRRDRGVSWSPVADDHPLAANGQRLRVELGVGVGGDQVEWFQRGWFVIQHSEPQGDDVAVEAVGLMALVDEARLVSPYQPSGTLLQTLRGLVEPAVTVVADGALVDQAVPAGINYDEDRLGAVEELLAAWAAEAAVTEDGYLYVKPLASSLTPVLELTDGRGGTVIQAAGASTRDDAFNVVVARGTATDGGQVQGVAYDYEGPKAYNGPFNPLPVPFFHSSPLLTTVQQCNTAARTVLARRKRDTGREFAVTMVPHPGLQAGDTVSVTTDDYAALPCSVEGLTLPYNPDGGAQTLRVRSLA